MRKDLRLGVPHGIHISTPVGPCSDFHGVIESYPDGSVSPSTGELGNTVLL